MNRRLIIICKHYPFYPEFIQNEAPILEKLYDKVDVFCVGNRRKKVTQFIGKNFFIHHKKELKNSNILKFIKYFFIGLFAKKDTLIIKTIKHTNGLKNILYSLFEYGLAFSEFEFVLKRLNIDTKNDVFAIYSFWFKDTAVAASLLKNKLKKKSIKAFAYSRAHGHDLYWERNPFGLVYQEFCLNCLDNVFPCSIHGEKYLIKRYPSFKNKIMHSYLGTKCTKHKKYFNNDDNGYFTIVTCSNIVKLKRLHLLIFELNKLSEMINKKVKWICIGTGDCLPNLKNNAANQSFIFESLGGMKNESVLDYYSNHKIDCFVNLSQSEGLPVSIMEAQSFGIPAFATNVGGTSEVIVENITGFLLPVDFLPGDLAKLLYKYYNLPDDCKKDFYKSSISNFLKNFDSDSNYNSFNSFILEKLCSKVCK